MSNQTIRLDGRKHSVPKGFVPILESLEEIKGIEKIIVGGFLRGGAKNGVGIFTKYYNPTTKQLKIVVQGRDFKQEVYLTIDESKRRDIEEVLSEYRL